MSDKAKLKTLISRKPAKKPERESTFKRWFSGLGQEWFTPRQLEWILLVILSMTTSLLLFPTILIKSADYRIGDVAARDIKASHDFLIENKELTEKDREKATREVLAVYDFDSAALNLVPSIREAFSQSRQQSGQPFDPNGQDQPEKTFLRGSETYNLAKERFFGILELTPDEELFAQFAEAGFPVILEEAIIGLLTEVSEKGILTNKTMMRNQMERGGIVLHELYSKKETRVADGERFFDVAGARNYIRGQSKMLQEKIGSPALAESVLKLTQLLIRPNLTYNQRETESRRELARESVKPVYYKVKKGEMLVREGERIDPAHLLKLTEGNKPLRGMNLIGRVPAMAVLIGILLSVLYIVGAQSLKKDSRHILFSGVTIFFLFIFMWVYNFVAEEVARGFPVFSSTVLLFAMPVAFGTMLISIFQGMNVALAASLIVSVLASLLTEGRSEIFVYFFISSLAAAYGVKNCNERVVLIKTGLMVGLINIPLSVAVQTLYGSFYSVDTLIAVTAGFIGGLLAGIIATGILPLIEVSFGFTTDIKLLELGNLDQPLLRELMVQAPGTYHHSVILSNMVEATAKAIHANPLLAKVSAYYHDIGKIKKPLYFIENQMGVENKHEKLAPSMSSLILISHVKDGVELAREYKLGREIINIIQQHHGTNLISYFYHKAQERVLTKSGKVADVKEEDFRYPGPKPQTKEAGLVMLADMVEAASRSLIDPTPARIQGMVQKIINKVFSDGQLDECELTLKDLHEIAKGFNKTLSGIFHQRIEYPEIIAKGTKKVKNGSSDQIPTEDSTAKKSEDKEETQKGLRRLGLT
ncbi:MAG: HDIG domain-containing protein [Deltaproteobacteria bacterium]|nr:HDIG domain-containing protein [Deltaproteobacteria bacterium]